MKRKIVLIIALALCAILALSLLAGCAETTDSAFSQGMIAVKKDGLWGFADESGEIVIDCKYDPVTPFYGAYAAVSMGGRTFLIGTDGEDAGIEIAGLDGVNKERTLMIVKDKHTGLYGALDTSSGEWKIAPLYDDLYFVKGEMILAELGGKVGLFDAACAELCPVAYDIYSGGSNAVVMSKITDAGYVADVFAADGALLEKDVRMIDMNNVGDLVYYRYYAESDAGASGERIKIPALNVDLDASVSSLVTGIKNVYVEKTTSKESGAVSYALKKADGTLILESESEPEAEYVRGLFYVEESEQNEQTGEIFTTRTYVDCVSGKTSVLGQNAKFYRTYDYGLYVALGNEVFAFGESAPLLTLAEGEELEKVLSGGMFAVSKDGLTSLKKDAKAVYAEKVGESIDEITGDSAYFTVKNAYGYVALYKADGKQLFGFDKEITEVIFAA